MTPIYGAVETGGTKCICLAASSPNEIFAETCIPTGAPETTTQAIADFFIHFQARGKRKISRIGIAAFGPLDLDTKSENYGHILATPKQAWKNWDVAGEMQRHLNLPIVLDTDVNGAALGEHFWGAAQGLENFIYLTIGTGIGGGGMLNGKLMHGLIHPEMGHILIPQDKSIDPFQGNCTFHKNCFEGLASGPAMEKRWGKPAELLPSDHPAWDLEADYIARGLHTFICTLSPERIILGGGVMHQAFLFEKVREKVRESLAGYVSSGAIFEKIEQYIVPPALGNRAGVLGALALAMREKNKLNNLIQDC